MKAIYLSPSKLSDFKSCSRCFWVAQNLKIKPPRGIFPSLPGGMDRVLKQYFDKYRGALPPELKDKVPGVLMKDMATLNKWRNWRSGLKCEFPDHAIAIGGALDDCLVDGEIYIPIDNKTKGSKPKDDGSQYYQTQLDCYNLMLRENGHDIAYEGYLIYWYPEKAGDDGNILFNIDIYKLACSADRALETMIKAAECLRGPIPKAVGCELCEYILLRATAGVI